MDVNNQKFFNLTMFILRLILGCMFFTSGAQKLFGMFNGLGLENTYKIVEGLGFYHSYLIGILWGTIEFAGGMFLVLGVFARYAAMSILFTVLMYTLRIFISYGYILQNNRLEYMLLIIAGTLPIIMLGGGKWSLWDD